MIFNSFKISAQPFIHDAYCKCGHELIEVPNGLMSRALFCAKCESVYEIVLRKIPDSKVTDEFLKQSREAVKLKKVK